jgi:hypothetical protein
MRFRIGMDGDVALVQMRDHGVGDDVPAGELLVDDRLLGNQDRDRGALRIVVLARDIEDVRADDVGHVREDLGQPVGVVLFIDVFDVAITLFRRHRIADIVDVEAERLGQVVETLELQTRERLYHGVIPRAGRGGERARIMDHSGYGLHRRRRIR